MKTHRLLSVLGFASIALASCSIVKAFEKDLYFEVVDGEDVWMTGKINTFNNAVLPQAPEKTGLKFYRYFLGEGTFDLATTPKKALLADEGLLRYNDSVGFAKNGKLKVSPIYLDPEDYPRPYLHVGWYDRSRTSKVDQTTIDKWTPGLLTFLEGYGATAEEIANVQINPFGNGGNVADLGAAVKKDGTVDVLVGVGGNIDSASGSDVAIVEKYQIKLQNDADWRYIALLTNRPQAVAVYEWLKTFEGHRALTGE